MMGYLKQEHEKIHTLKENKMDKLEWLLPDCKPNKITYYANKDKK